MVVRGDVLTFAGQVTRMWEGRHTGNGYVDVELSADTNRHSAVLTGELTFALPHVDGRPPEFPVDVDFDESRPTR
jgi:hypothetical protein